MHFSSRLLESMLLNMLLRTLWMAKVSPLVLLVLLTTTPLREMAQRRIHVKKNVSMRVKAIAVQKKTTIVAVVIAIVTATKLLKTI